MNVPPLPPAVNKRLSRSNSVSSSASTVKYIGAKIGHRSTHSTTRPTSSDSINHHFSVLDAAAEQSNPESASNPPGASRSPNRLNNRWSHSRPSNMTYAEKESMRQVQPNSIAARAAKFEASAKSSVIPKSQYSVRQPSDPSVQGSSSRRSPGRRPRSPRKSSPDASRVGEIVERVTPLARTPDLDLAPSRTANNDYFGTTVLDHSRGANKFGQTVEGIALQVTSSHSRQRRSEQSKPSGHGLHEANNSSHISVQKKAGHSRRKERSENGSRDTATGTSVSSLRSDSSKRISNRSPLQKNMLSQALAKANQAVLLDNALDIQGAIQAYVQACDILEQVMVRSSDEEDRKKLSAIRNTYSSRIADLYDIDRSFDHLQNDKESQDNTTTDKELPEAPATTHYLEGQDRVSFEDSGDENTDGYESSTILDADEGPQRLVQIPIRQESLLPQIFGGERYIEQQPPPSRNKVPPLDSLKVPMDTQYMPPPLSPRRPLSPVQSEDQATPVVSQHPHQPQNVGRGNHLSSGSTSWLDTVDDTRASSRSSRPSSAEYGMQDEQLVSAIESQFDAMNAAVDAAYEDELQMNATPRPSETKPQHQHHPGLSTTHETHSLVSQPSQQSIASDVLHDDTTNDDDEDEAQAQEEEALLDMMMADGFKFDGQNQRVGTMSSLPRQSDSSGFSVRSSGRTWESSLTTATNGTTLSTLAEGPETPLHATHPTQLDGDESILPSDEVDDSAKKQASPLPPTSVPEKPGLRDRRMSGQSATQLKIETFTRRPSLSKQGQPGQAPVLELPPMQQQSLEPILSATATDMNGNILPVTPLTSIHSGESIESPATPGLTKVLSNSTLGEEPVYESRMPHIRKNTSSSNLRPRNLSVTTNDLDNHPPTPGSANFTALSRHGTSITTPAMSNASPSVLSGAAVGGMYIFDHILDDTSSTGLRSPDGMQINLLPLEPCPESFLLRPFWLMRCLYQTMAHPKGGYITTKLFVPRDIWRVKGVKIKGIEDKIGQCDVLTAALLKLAKVDTLDADAVCGELHSFEIITDNTRVQLQKKLGGDVGITGSMAAMKASPAEDDSAMSKTASSMKSFTNSWKKLRSKSSTAVTTPPANLGVRKETSNDISMPSLPMTSSSAIQTSRSYKNHRYPPPTPSGVPFIPPQHANYMSSLARLFDAVQVLDSIARQVEDPGLKGTSQSHVGLELSIRGAAEFFSFYILRFVLADVGMLLDKYLKRNAEWVMT